MNFQGIDGQLIGSLNLRDQPNKPTMANGQLRLVNGKYKAYGQELKIKQGVLNFAGGPIDNPSITLRASRTIKTAGGTGPLSFAGENIEAGISVVGRIKKPKITLFSSPSGISQADILSYLVIGQPLSSVKVTGSDNDQKKLLGAALTIGLNSSSEFSHVTNSIKNALGLSEFGLETEQDTVNDKPLQNTALVLGKYLSPKFYVSYSYGVFNKVNVIDASTVRARYQINKKFSIQTEASTKGSGIDLLYSFERN